MAEKTKTRSKHWPSGALAKQNKGSKNADVERTLGVINTKTKKRFPI